MKEFFKKTENIIRKVISCRFLYYIAAILLFLGTYYLDLKTKVEGAGQLDGNHLKYFLIVAGVTGILVAILTIFSKKLYQKLPAHIVYIILALLIGGIYIFVIPLCAQSDEPAHLYRAWQTAKGEIVAPLNEGEFKTELPKSLVDMIYVNSEGKLREYKKYYDIKEMAKIPLNEDETEMVNTVGNYHGVSYLPQIVGLKIGMLCKLTPYCTAMLGRITGLIITVFLFAWGIYKLPKHKLFATIILLCPVVLSYAASFSADNMTLASVFLLISYVYYYMHTKEKIKKRHYILFAILTFIIAVSKIAYIPIIGIFIFLPKECFENNKRKWICAIGFIVLGFITTIWWMRTAAISATGGDPTNTNTWIYTNPIGYLIVLFRTTISSAWDYVSNMFAGHYLCHNQVNPYSIVPIAYIIIAVIAYFSDENTDKTTMYKKLISFGIIACSYVLISTAMYVYNTSFKSGTIMGVQGRYLVPLLFMLIFFANSKKWNVQEHRLTNVALITNYVVYLAMMTKFFI